MPYRESPEEFRTVHSTGSSAERRMVLRNVEDGLGALHLSLLARVQRIHPLPWRTVMAVFVTGIVHKAALCEEAVN